MLSSVSDVGIIVCTCSLLTLLLSLLLYQWRCEKRNVQPHLPPVTSPVVLQCKCNNAMQLYTHLLLVILILLLPRIPSLGPQSLLLSLLLRVLPLLPPPNHRTLIHTLLLHDLPLLWALERDRVGVLERLRRPGAQHDAVRVATQHVVDDHAAPGGRVAGAHATRDEGLGEEVGELGAELVDLGVALVLVYTVVRCVGVVVRVAQPDVSSRSGL